MSVIVIEPFLRRWVPPIEFLCDKNPERFEDMKPFA